MSQTRFTDFTEKGRKLALGGAVALVCAAALSFTGCKKTGDAFHALKNKLKGEKPAASEQAAAAPASGASGESEAAASPAAENADATAAGVPAVPVAAAPAAPAKPAINKNAVAIALCYHNIEDNSRMKALTISTAEFEKEMQAIKDNGFTVIGLQDFLAFRRGEKDIPAKSAIITIDDGWVSGYENAWPILKKFGYPFTLFIYINYVGTGGKSMSWDQLAEMRDAGVDIQSHTYSHSNLKIPGAGMDKTHSAEVKREVATLGFDGWLRKEIAGSKEVLEKQLGIKVNALAYPFGVYNQKVRDAIKAAGYEAAFTVYGQQLRFSTPPYDLLGRYAVDAGKPQIFYTDAMKMIGGGATTGPVAPVSNVSEVAPASMNTQPKDGETISNLRPTISANLAAMGNIEPESVQMRVSGIGAAPAAYDAKTKTVSFTVKRPLREKSYTVIISAKADGKPVEARWSFNFDPAKAGAAGQ